MAKEIMYQNETEESGVVTLPDGTKLKGYLTPDGWFGEIQKGVFQTFDTEKEWVKYCFSNN